MIKGKVIFYLVIVLLTGLAASSQTTDESIQNAVKTYSEWINVMTEITTGVEFNERDMQNFLKYFSELEELDIGDMDEEDPVEFRKNFDAAISDPEYLSWAAARGLDPKTFLKNSMRITSLFMLEQAAIQDAEISQQWEEHAAMIEEQCAQTDQKTCENMKATLEASKAIQKATVEAHQQIRPASASERLLLDRYGSELEAVMMEEDNGDDFYEDEDEYYEDEDEFYEEEDELYED